MMAIGTVIVMWPNVRERAALAAALTIVDVLGHWLRGLTVVG
jgi:hypothetical protein